MNWWNWRRGQRAERLDPPAAEGVELRGRLRHPAEQPPPLSAGNEPSVRSTATAPEPPVRVASEYLNVVHRPRLEHLLDHDVVDLAGGLARDDHARPDLAQLDPVGDVDHPLSTPRQALLTS